MLNASWTFLVRAPLSPHIHQGFEAGWCLTLYFDDFMGFACGSNPVNSVGVLNSCMVFTSFTGLILSPNAEVPTV